MNPTLIASLRTLLADPDRFDRDALFAVLDDTQAARVLACLAPPGSLAQIAAALRIGWSWDGDGWDRQTDGLVRIITDPHCSIPKQMIRTWSDVPDAVGVLRDRTDDLVAWAQQRLNPRMYAELALLLGPSNASARLLVQSHFPPGIGTTLRRWSMAISPDAPTAWQAMIDADLHAALHSRATPSMALPAWRWDDAVDSGTVLDGIVNDLAAGWSPDHPSLRGRIGWIEHHISSYLYVGKLARVASIGRSDALAEAVCVRVLQNHWDIQDIVHAVPWSHLHPHIRSTVDTTMQESSDDRWKGTWACAIGRSPLVTDTTIDANLLMWRIAPEQWEALDSKLRAALVSRSDLPHHCYGWGIHPYLVAGGGSPDGRNVRYWNPDVPPDDLRARAYADLLHAQSTLQDAQVLIALLNLLPSNRRARFETIIDGRLGGRPEVPAQPPWDWAGWATLPAADRLTRLRDRLAILWGDRATLPALRFWRARNDGLATLAMMVGEVLDLDDPIPILAALLAQTPALRGDETDVGSSLPFPDDLDATRRAQIERLPIDPNAQAYATWCLRVLDQDMGLGSTLIALHPTVAVALAPLLNADQQKAVAVSPAAQGWESVTFLSWIAACASAQELPMPPIQRRIR